MPWRRLGTTQLRNSIADVVAFALRDQPATAEVMKGLTGALAALAPDERQKTPQDLHGSFRRLDQQVDPARVESAFRLAQDVGAALADPARVSAVLGACGTNQDRADDSVCLAKFAARFAERALRRPLMPGEADAYAASVVAAGSTSIALGELITTLLSAPEFLYHVEHGDAPVAGKPGVFRLTEFELANRLAYHFWDAPPDDVLVHAARSGALLDELAYAREVDRVLDSPRARPVVSELFRDWLKLDDVPPLDARNADPVFKAFAGPDLPGPGLREQMVEEVLGMAEHLTWTAGGALHDLLTTELSFARGAELALLYQVPRWDGAGSPPAFPKGLRPGFLTRAAFLASGSANTRPIMKGLFVRETVLCDQIPPPPDNAMASPPQLDARLSTRQVVERLTEMPGTACAACHATLINPIGFATENFDALGRVREAQRLFSERGEEIGRAALDTRSVPQIVPGDSTPSRGALDLVNQIAKSGKAHACFARQYVRFTFGRWDDLAGDGCLLDRLQRTLRSGANLREVLRTLALAPEFRERTILMERP